MGTFMAVYMLDPEEHVEEAFSFDKFMLDQEKTWDGPYMWEED